MNPLKPVGARKKSSQQDLDALDISNTEQEDPLNLGARQNQLDARKRSSLTSCEPKVLGPQVEPWSGASGLPLRRAKQL